MASFVIAYQYNTETYVAETWIIWTVICSCYKSTLQKHNNFSSLSMQWLSSVGFGHKSNSVWDWETLWFRLNLQLYLSKGPLLAVYNRVLPNKQIQRFFKYFSLELMDPTQYTLRHGSRSTTSAIQRILITRTISFYCVTTVMTD